MVITLTPLTKSQAFKVIKVVLWIGVSIAASAVPALLTKDDKFLALAPLLNIAGVTIREIATQEENRALVQLPPPTQAEIEAVQRATETTQINPH